jgi:4-amino-4-deoxy-L-arabinose transferase-like glycosyltransferase
MKMNRSAHDSNVIEDAPAAEKRFSFREFFNDSRSLLLSILLAAFAWRLVLVIGFPHYAHDEIRYITPAINMLAGRGFSSEVVAPYRPTEHTMPLYPIFIAGVYAIFGESNLAVRIAQAVLDSLTGLLVAFVAFNLAPVSVRRESAISAMACYGFFSWFTVIWTAYILTETLAIFLTMLAVAMSVWASRGRFWRWLSVGLVCGLAILTRADSGLLAMSFVLYLTIQIVRLRAAETFISLFLFCFATTLVLTPWIARNYVAFGKFQPLASPYGAPRGEVLPMGYLLWTETWLSTYESNYRALDPFFYQGTPAFNPGLLPPSAFDSATERDEVVRLISRQNSPGMITTEEFSGRFQELALERIKRAPTRYFVWLPLQRIASNWLTGFATTNDLHRFARIMLVLPILLGGLLGFVVWARNSMIVSVLVLLILTRTIYFAYVIPESRYIVEAYPAMIAGCGVACAVVWSSVTTALKEKWWRWPTRK